MRCRKKYGTKYEYSDYKGYNKPVNVLNTETGERFSINAQHHLEHNGRSNSQIQVESLANFEVFKQKALEEGKVGYNYLEYKWSERKVVFFNTETEKVYEQDIYEHLKGVCLTERKDITFKRFVDKAEVLHNFEYAYYDYVNYNEPLTVLHKATGLLYKQRIQHILKGCKPKATFCKYSPETFAQLASELHRGRFEYKDFRTLSESVTVIDTTTGLSYKQEARGHLRGSLPKEISFSNVSRVELEIQEILVNLFPDCTLITGSRPKFLNRKELDVFIPELNLAIEYNGTIYHHSSLTDNKFLNNTYKDPLYHYEKSRLCLENGIKLIHIFDFQYKTLDIKSLILSYVNSDIKLVGNKEVFVDKKSITEKGNKENNLSVFVPEVLLVANVTPNQTIS